jgi:hypothetical protein
MSIPACGYGSSVRHPSSVGNVLFFVAFHDSARDCTTVTLDVDNPEKLQFGCHA